MSLTLSEHLPLIASAPDGIQKLRGLILELAVRGKLVPQNPKDEPASELLKRIAKERTRLHAEEPCKKSKATLLVDLNLRPFEIPDGWEWTTLGQVGETNIGLTYSPTNLSTVGMPVLRSSNVQKGMIDLSDLIRVNMPVKDSVLVREGDLLICARNGSKALVGKTALITGLGEEMAFGAFMAIFRSIANPYLLYFINSPLFRRTIDDVNTTTINQITQGNLKATAVPLPPLAEQRRIVVKVDQLMALCDRLESEQNDSAAAHTQLVETLLGTLTQSADAADFEANWKRIAEHFDTLFTTEASIDSMKKAVLRLALTGKLVRQSPEDEPADLLLQKIAAKKLQLIEAGNVKSQKPLAEINDNEKPFELPRGWVWARLQNVIDVRDGTHDSPKDSSEPETYPLVTSKNFINGEIDFISARRISALDHFEIAKRSAVEKFDILFSMIGGNLGNQVMVKDERPFSIKNVALFKYYDNKMTSPFFVKKYMEHLAIDLQNQASGGAQPFVSLGHLRNLVFALPPMTEQLRIVAKVDALMSVCESLKAKLAAAEREQSTLADTLIKQALAA